MNANAHGRDRALRLVIVGGGFTGAVLAIHAIRASERPLAITMLEPSAELGRGVAYGTPDPSHRINVPSDRMALSVADPEEATRWFWAQGVLPDKGSHDGQGSYYVPRWAYGAFVADALRRAVAGAGSRLSFHHEPTRVAAIQAAAPDSGCEWHVTGTDGTVHDADVVALCFGHAAPAAPSRTNAEAERHPKFVADPWAPQALAAIGPTDSVLVVGTGLTMADVAMSLDAMGHTGPVTAISRRGLLPQGHGLFRSDVDLFEGRSPPRTALGLVRLIRRRIREAGPMLGWHPVVDTLRSQLPEVWGALPPEEKRKVVRRLLPFWEIHRFRIAPQIDAALKRTRAEGRLSIERSGFIGLDIAADALMARMRKADGSVAVRAFDAVVLCTGPDRDLRGNPLIARMLADGLAQLDDTGLGLAVDRQSRLTHRDGPGRPGLFAFGPMTRGSFGEMTGAPDIARHIEQVVGALLSAA